MQRLGSYLLNVVYVLLLIVLSPWLLYVAIFKAKYRQGLVPKFLGLVPRRPGNTPCLWLHAVSVGEVNLLSSLIQEIKLTAPELECVISTTTITGFELARAKYRDHLVFYCPLDFSWAVRTAMRRIRPTVLVLAELELWPNLVFAAKAYGARVAIVNGRLSERSYRGYARIRPLVGRVLQQLDVITAQNEVYAERFRMLGAVPDTVHVTGSMKFDGARFDRTNPATCELARLWKIESSDVIFLAGSTGEPEEALALAAFAELEKQFTNLRLILVPRHAERFRAVEDLLRNLKVQFDLRSRLSAGTAAASRILLVDTIGELGAWWGTAEIAFVGGSLNKRGGQNMLEPAAYGAAVAFGPDTRNFRDIVALLLANEAAVVVGTFDELKAYLRLCLERPDRRAELGENARRLVRAHQGATRRTVSLLVNLQSSTGHSGSSRRAA